MNKTYRCVKCIIPKSKLRNAALLSSISASNSVVPLCPKLLIQESLITDDPLFDFCTPEHEASKVQNEALGFKKEGIDLRRLQNKLLYFYGLSKFMESGFLHSLPLSILHRAPAEIPIYAPRNFYRELVPDDAIDLVRASAIVSPLKKTPQGLVIEDGTGGKRTRQVCIEFKDDEQIGRASCRERV